MQDALTFSRIRLLLAPAVGAIVLASLTGCGGGGGDGAPPLALDACSPVDGSMDIDRDIAVTALFDQPVALGIGSVTLTVDGGDPQPISSEVNDTMLLVSPPGTGDVALWPAAADIELTFSGFESAEGGELEAPVTCTYTTIDDEEPVPEAFIPQQNVCISARIDGLRVVFNEPMNTDPTIGEFDEVAPFRDVNFFVPRSEAVWEVAPDDPDDAAPRVLFIPRLERSLLAYNQEYQINFRDFVDLAGNVIRNGQFAYRFCVGEDNESPRVVDITPAYLLQDPDGDGQLTDGAENVDPQATDEICITFDEDMNVGQNQARLVIDGEDSEFIRGTWDDLERTICFDLSLGNGATLLRPNAEHRLILGAIQDQAGNFISNDPILIDNSLDFTSGLDENPPAVVMSTPPEGTLEADFANLPELVLVFNEPIVEEAVGTLTLDVDDGAETITFEPGVGYTWDDDSVTLTIDLTTVEGFALEPTTPYTVDLSTITDVSGNTVDSESLGGDTTFDFTTRQPTGELCSEAVRIRDGDTDVMGGLTGVDWVIDEGSADENDGGTTDCDENPGNDLVFEYIKASPSVAEDPVNGRYLSVQLNAEDRGDAMNVQIFSEVCDPEAEGNQDVACYTFRSRWNVVRDLPAGTYYIWVAGAGGGIPAAELAVRELDVVFEGDSCFDPFDADSAIYTAPSGEDGARWNIPAGSIAGADHTESNVGGFTCGRGFGAHGLDAVIEFEKATDASFLTVNVQTSGMADRIRVELVDTCDPTQATGAAFCTRNGDRNELVSFEGGTFLPAGTYYLWVAANSPQTGGGRSDRIPFPETEVEIIETPLDPGEGCAVARVVGSPGTISMERDSDVTVDTPTCFDQGVAVNWWKYEAVNGGVAFAPNANSRVVLADATDGAELLCEPNSSGAAVGRIVDPGDELCVGIPVDSDATSFAVRDIAYSGVQGTTSDLGVTFPASATITVDYFMANDGDDIFLGYFDAGAGDARVAQFGKTGSVTATIYDDTDGADLGTVGRGGVVANGSLFSFDDRSNATSDKLYRIYNGTNFQDTRWDTGSAAYPDRTPVRGLATDGSGLFFPTNETDALEPTIFYSRTASSAGAVTNEGSNEDIFRVTGIAADDTYYYVAGVVKSGVRSGIYRIGRSDVGGTVEALTPTLTITSNQETSLELDDLTNPQYLYFGVDDPDGIHVIADPDGATPTYLGEIVGRNAGDTVFTYDRGEDVIYMYDTTGGNDAILEVE